MFIGVWETRKLSSLYSIAMTQTNPTVYSAEAVQESMPRDK
jgi:hypothetical protein